MLLFAYCDQNTRYDLSQRHHINQRTLYVKHPILLNIEINKKKISPRFVFVFLDESRQTEICDLADVVLADQNVSGSQIAVDVVLGLQVGHAGGDLSSHVDQLRQFERAALTLKNKRKNGIFNFCILCNYMGM